MASRNILLTLVLLTGLALSARAAAQAVSLQDPYAVDEFIDGLVAAERLPFLYLRIESLAGRVLYEHSAVNNDALPGVVVDGQSWMRIWSMTKIVTISLALDLIEEGRLSMDDDISQYLPELEGIEVAVAQDGTPLLEAGDAACPMMTIPATKPITVRDLINHTAGFYYAVNIPPCLAELATANNLATADDSGELRDTLARLPLIQQPGAGYQYGFNTSVLGLVLERVTRDSLQELVEARITGPLRIRGLRYGAPEDATLIPIRAVTEEGLRPLAPGEQNIFGGPLPSWDENSDLFLGGEGMVGTADGYADFLRMLLARGELRGRRYLNIDTVEEMVAPQTQLEAPNGYNGYNIFVTGGNAPVHGLWTGGGYEGTFYWIDPGRQIVGVGMTQAWSQEFGALWATRTETIKAVYDALSD
ncbi:MAG: serine hydrolase domain-containing protein [Pseudomonadota bacterium]